MGRTAGAIRSHKFNASKARYNGTVYHSKKEAAYAARLDMLKKAADPKERVDAWERQVKIPLVVNGKLIANWYVDFRIVYADLRIEYHEVKGFQTEDYRLKRKLFEAIYPDYVLKVLR